MTQVLLRSLAATVLLVSNPCLAQDEATTPVESKPNVEIENRGDGPQDESQYTTSEDNRGTKKFGLGLGLGAFQVPITGGGLNFHYNQTSSLQFELSLWSGDWDAKSDLYDTILIDIERAKVESTLVNIKAKYFVGNSFYVSGGLGQRTIDFDVAARSSDGYLATKLETTSTFVSLAIGNIWTFDGGFYIGGEWLALYIPLTSKDDTSVTSSGNVGGDLTSFQRDVDDVSEDLSDTTTVGVATLQLGWQF